VGIPFEFRIRTCYEKGINARITDEIVWQGVAGLMSSPKLLMKQIARWSKQRHDSLKDTGILVGDMKKEIARLKDQEDRYSKAYGAGLFPLDKFKEYMMPLREKIAAIEAQIVEAEIYDSSASKARLPATHEVEVFAEKALRTLHNLNFEAKRVIVMDVVEKIIGTQKELIISGNIPIEKSWQVKNYPSASSGFRMWANPRCSKY
jgi:site-specific DNA recombinase